MIFYKFGYSFEFKYIFLMNLIIFQFFIKLIWILIMLWSIFFYIRFWFYQGIVRIINIRIRTNREIVHYFHTRHWIFVIYRIPILRNTIVYWIIQRIWFNLQLMIETFCIICYYRSFIFFSILIKRLSHRSFCLKSLCVFINIQFEKIQGPFNFQNASFLNLFRNQLFYIFL
jgi:hypothetical protein